VPGGLGIFIPTSYETFLVNRLRYLWPFSAPWLLGWPRWDS
jgi:hypothetical protein